MEVEESVVGWNSWRRDIWRRRIEEKVNGWVVLENMFVIVLEELVVD